MLVRDVFPRLATLAAVACVLAAGCSVKRLPSHDPSSQPPPKPYDFQGEAQSPPPPAVQPAPAAGASEPPPTLETPTSANLTAPPVEVQDLPPPPASGGAPRPSESDVPPQVGSRVPAPPGGRAGYRVQVFASPDRAAAERMRGEIESRLDVKAYVAFQEPYYKVRVGNCASSEACRELQERLRAAGYETLWVVPDTIVP